MALLDDVKRRLGVFYLRSRKDAEIQQMIDAQQNISKAGGIGSALPLATDKVVLYLAKWRNLPIQRSPLITLC